MERHSSEDFSLNPVELVQVLRTHLRWWVIPAVAGFVIAASYAVVAPRNWRATQAFTVRPEAASISEQRLGKFADLSEMKVQQATILELAKSSGVVSSTLKAVGPASTSFFSNNSNFPTAKDVDDFRKNVDLRPPGGAEFGQSEVFYLSVRDNNSDRSAALVAALSDQLEKRMQTLRDERAQSMMAEMEKTVAMAESDLAARNDKLAQFETKIGADLAELRNLNAGASSQSEASQELQSIEAERRANDAKLRENEQLLTLLKAAQDDPRQLIATPNSLLVSQPGLSRLKDALIDAQIRSARLLGTLAEDHPFVITAKETEKLVQAQLHDEIALAIKGLETDLKFTSSRESSLQSKWDGGRGRIANLAAARAEYASLVAAVDNHTKLVEAARKNLADARADHASAHSASVIARIDGVEAGVRPDGPSRSTIAAAGGVAGLVFGFGLVFLFAGSKQAGGLLAPVEARKSKAPQPVAAGAKSSNGDADSFGLFRGMSLEQAIRSVENRGNGRGVR